MADDALDRWARDVLNRYRREAEAMIVETSSHIERDLDDLGREIDRLSAQYAEITGRDLGPTRRA